MSEYETMKARGGHVIQAGIPSRSVEAEEQAEAYMRGFITRAVVESVYYPDDKDRLSGFGGIPGGWFDNCLLVDVRTLGPVCRRLLRVPVCQRTQGLHDMDWYVPRPSVIDISGDVLRTESSSTVDGPPTRAELMDGDHVLVAFLTNNPDLPIVLPFTLGHPRGDYLQRSNGRVKYMGHAGTYILWSEDGNLLLDASGAAWPGLSQDGKEISKSGTSGIVTITTRDASKSQSYFRLDNLGGVRLEDSAGHYVELLKSGTISSVVNSSSKAVISPAKIEAVSTDIKLSCLDNFTVNSSTTNITPTANCAITSLSVNVVSPSVKLGSDNVAILAPVMKLTVQWAFLWGALYTTAELQAKIYEGPPKQTVVAVPHYLELLQKIKALCDLVVGPDGVPNPSPMAAGCSFVKGF